MPQELSPHERARKNEQVILSALTARGQKDVAQDMGCAESTVSDLKNTAISRVAAVMAHAGLKAVPVGMRCYTPEYVESLQVLAAIGIRNQAPRLDWEEGA